MAHALSPPVNPGPSFAGFTGAQVTTSVEVVALVLPAVQHPSSIRKLGTDDATGQTPPVSRGLSRARKEDPAPALQDKATGSSSI